MSKEQIILYLGREEYLIQEGLWESIHKLLPLADQDFNYQMFYGDDLTAEVFINAASTWPFGGDKRLIVVKNIELIRGADLEKIGHFLDEGLPSFLYLIFTAVKIQEKNGIYKHIKKNGQIISCESLPDAKKINWLVEKAKKLGLSLTPTLARQIVIESGLPLHGLWLELQKLSLFQKAKDSFLTAEDVNLLVHGQNNENIFVLSDAVAGKDMVKACELIEHLLRQGEAEVNIVGLLSKQFRQLLAAKIILQKGGNADQMAQKLSLHPYAAKIACTQCYSFSMGELVEGLYRMADFDYEVKRGKYNAQRGLYLLLFYLMQKTA